MFYADDIYSLSDSQVGGVAAVDQQPVCHTSNEMVTAMDEWLNGRDMWTIVVKT